MHSETPGPVRLGGFRVCGYFTSVNGAYLRRYVQGSP